MATNYPSSQDDNTTLPNPSSGTYTNDMSLASGQSNQNDSIRAVEDKLGYGSNDQRPRADRFLVGVADDTTEWSKEVPQGEVVGTTDTQTLTNKTIDGATIEGGSIENAVVNVDVIDEYSDGLGVTIEGVLLKDGAVSGDLGFKSDDAYANSAVNVSSNSYLPLGPSTTIDVGESGIVLLTWSCRFNASGTNDSGAVATFSASGANSIPVSDDNGTAGSQYRYAKGVCFTRLLTGLNAGMTTFTVNYRRYGGNANVEAVNRRISAVAL